MSDFTSGFWSLFIVVIALGGVLACGYLLWAQSKHKSAVTASGDMETSGHVWDEDLEEYNHPLPKWWMWMFYITVVFALVYWSLYPGLGTFKGVLGWTSAGQWQKEVAETDAKTAPIFEKFSKMDLKAVAADKEANEIGRRLFLTYCMQCHGSAGTGSKGFPNLANADWQWGGEPEQIKQSIAEGRNGMMPKLGLSADAVRDVASYVRSLSGQASDSVRAAKGRDVFATAGCAACHGPDAKGNPAMGAPNLTDNVWLYGGSEAAISETVNLGRQNRMPAWKEFLGDAKIHLLTAYVMSLSEGGSKP